MPRSLLVQFNIAQLSRETNRPGAAVEADVRLALDERDEAVALLREAFARGLAHGFRVHTETALEPLRDYPPFVELVRPKG